MNIWRTIQRGSFNIHLMHLLQSLGQQWDSIIFAVCIFLTDEYVSYTSLYYRKRYATSFAPETSSCFIMKTHIRSMTFITSFNQVTNPRFISQSMRTSFYSLLLLHSTKSGLANAFLTSDYSFRTITTSIKHEGFRSIFRHVSYVL